MTRKAKKRWLAGGIALVILALLAGLWLRLFPPRWAVERYVLGHQEALNGYALQLLATDPARLEDYRGWSAEDSYDGWKVSYYPQSGKIEFQAAAFGLAPSTAYTGFYYSPEDVPLGYQGSPVEFVREGDGWLWEEPEGDNRQYTQRIAEHWYWYEAKF